MRFVFAVTATDIGLWAFTAVGMGVVGYVVWRVLQKQESRDPAFLKKLDDDDARANGGAPQPPDRR